MNFFFGVISSEHEVEDISNFKILAIRSEGIFINFSVEWANSSVCCVVRSLIA